MEDDIKAKQDYLYQEIIDKNYDPEEFQQYIMQRKGLSLQQYSMKQLMAIVQAFKKGQKYQPQQQNQQVIQPDASFIQHNELDNIQLQGKIEERDRQELKRIKQGDYERIQSSTNSSNKVCHQFVLKQTVSTIYKRIYEKKEKIRVKIRSYSKIQEQSFFGTTYISYLIETPQLNWSVRRRFKDFQWLQANLIQLFPGYPIPPIPKKTTLRSFDDQHLEERMNIFEKYIHKLTNIPQICSEPIFEDFLRISSEQQFVNCKNKFDLMLNNRGNRIASLKGQNIINKSQFKLELSQYQFYKRQREIMQNLNLQIGNLQNLLKQTTNKAFQVSSCFGQLHNHLSSKNTFKGVGVLELIGDFVSELGYKLDSEQCFIHTEIEGYWRYQEKYVQNIVGYMSKINKEHYEMLSKFKNMGSYEIDIQEQKKNGLSQKKLFNEYQQARENYRIKLSFIRSEIDRYQENDLMILSKQWVNGLQTYMGGVKDLMLSGVDQLTRAQCVSQGKRLVEVEYSSKKNQSRQVNFKPVESIRS